MNENTAKDKRWTYLEIQKAWPDKAGKLFQVLTTQKRLINKMAAKRGLDDDTKALLISVAEGYDVAVDLMAWMKQTLKEVAADANALYDGARMRQTIAEQSELITAYFDAEMRELENKRKANAAHL